MSLARFWQGFYIETSYKMKMRMIVHTMYMMNKGGLKLSKNIEETVENLITPMLEERKVELVDIQYEKEGQDWFLRIYVDTEDGIDLNECSIVSEKVSDILDKSDPIQGSYFLEVSSPGAERPLKSEQDFENHLNENVYVTLYAPVDGAKEYEGILINFEDNIATIEYKVKTRKKQVDIPYEKIAKARLAVTL